MKPERAEHIPWHRCSRLNLHDGTAIAVGVGSAEYDLLDRAVYYQDAAAAHTWSELHLEIHEVKKVTCGRGLTTLSRVMRNVAESLTPEDILMMQGYELEGFDALTPRQQRGLLKEHPTIASVSRAVMERQARERALKEAEEMHVIRVREEAKRKALNKPYGRRRKARAEL